MQSLVADMEVFTILSLCLAFNPGGSSRDRIRTRCTQKSFKNKPSQQWRLGQTGDNFSLQQRAVVSPGQISISKISQSLQTVEVPLSVLTSHPSLFLLQTGFHGWSMGKNWKVQLVSITGTLCAKDCSCDPVVLCSYSLFNCKCCSLFPCL